MGKSSSRKNRRREATRSVPTNNSRRYVPYSKTSWQKKFSALRAGDYSYPRRTPKQNQRSRYVKTRLRVVSNPKRLATNYQGFGPLVRRLSGQTVLDTTGQKSLPKKQRSLCESRTVRERVIHAIGKAGLRGQKPPKWTLLSRKRCK